jgi:hypothetical protein
MTKSVKEVKEVPPLPALSPVKGERNTWGGNG